MTLKAETAGEVAEHFWARVAGEPRTLEQVALAAERVHALLRAGLGRWIGAEGYRALVDRALAVAEPEHPALGRLAFLGGDEPETTVTEHADRAAELSSGMVALIAAEIALLSSIVGDDMATRLMEQINTTTARNGANTDSE